MTMTCEVAEKIYVHHPTQEMLSWCMENLILPNPDYAKKERMGLWVGNTPREYFLYEKVADNVLLPFGCLQELHERFPDMPMRSRICRAERFSFESHINPYPYQENAIQAILERRNGVLVMPCGSGKTQTALEAVSRIGMRTLWLTHTQDLLTQSMNRAKAVYGAGKDCYGTITGGKVNVGRGITFATVQTAAKIDLTPYRDEFGCIIVDECHRAVGSPTRAMQFFKVLSNLSCRYKIGLTATPKRADGLSKMMFSLIGGVAHEVTREAVADTTCPVFVKQVKSGYVPNLDIALAGDGTINYAGLVDDLTHNDSRMEFVLDIIRDLPKESPALILANRVEYLQTLQKKCGRRSICLSGMGASKAAKEQRKAALQQLNAGEIDCLFATYQLAKEGLDVPNLRYVIFATPEKDESTVIQAAGRVARKYPGKDIGTVIDIVDDFGMLVGWAKRRKGIYTRKLGFAVDDGVGM